MLILLKVRVRVRSATTSNLVCAHVCVRTSIWTCEVRACDPKNGRNSHLDYFTFMVEIVMKFMGKFLFNFCVLLSGNKEYLFLKYTHPSLSIGEGIMKALLTYIRALAQSAQTSRPIKFYIPIINSPCPVSNKYYKY